MLCTRPTHTPTFSALSSAPKNFPPTFSCILYRGNSLKLRLAKTIAWLSSMILIPKLHIEDSLLMNFASSGLLSLLSSTTIESNRRGGRKTYGTKYSQRMPPEKPFDKGPRNTYAKTNEILILGSPTCLRMLFTWGKFSKTITLLYICILLRAGGRVRRPLGGKLSRLPPDSLEL